MSKKYASLNTLQTFLKNLKNLFATQSSVEELSSNVAYIDSTDNENITDVETGGGAVVANAVLYTPQTLTEAQQAQARENIGVDNVASVQSDWNAAEGEDGHILNRTHYVDADGIIHKLDNKFINAEWMATKESTGGAIEWEADLVFTTSAYIMLPTKFYPNIGSNYDVYWNGVKYTCTAFEQSGELFLGNRELISDDTPNIPTNAPFCFSGWALSGSTPVINSVRKDTSTAETISVKITTEEISHYNVLPDKYLSDDIVRISDTVSVGQTIVAKSVDADGKPVEWESAEYQPRTHWVDSVDETMLVEEQTLTIDEDYASFDGSLVLEVGKTYAVSFNGTVYECVARYYDYWDCVLLGNSTICNNEDISSGEPFAIDIYSDGTFYLNVTNSGTYTVSISEITENIHKLDSKYLHIATDEDIMDLLYEIEIVNPVTSADDSILTSSIGEIYSL